MIRRWLAISLILIAGEITWAQVSGTFRNNGGTVEVYLSPSWVSTYWGNTNVPCGGSPSGTIRYNSGAGRSEYCDGTNWMSMKGPSGGSCSGTAAGTIDYNSGANNVRICDGSTWWWVH